MQSNKANRWNTTIELCNAAGYTTNAYLQRASVALMSVDYNKHAAMRDWQTHCFVVIASSCCLARTKRRRDMPQDFRRANDKRKRHYLCIGTTNNVRQFVSIKGIFGGTESERRPHFFLYGCCEVIFLDQPPNWEYNEFMCALFVKFIISFLVYFETHT